MDGEAFRLQGHPDVPFQILHVHRFLVDFHHELALRMHLKRKLWQLSKIFDAFFQNEIVVSRAIRRKSYNSIAKIE